jgi:hypothetical protein
MQEFVDALNNLADSQGLSDSLLPPGIDIYLKQCEVEYDLEGVGYNPRMAAYSYYQAIPTTHITLHFESSYQTHINVGNHDTSDRSRSSIYDVDSTAEDLASKELSAPKKQISKGKIK